MYALKLEHLIPNGVKFLSLEELEKARIKKEIEDRLKQTGLGRELL
jgi:hypothetical protein